MEVQTQTKTGLPENAYRELGPGESYHPTLSPEYVFPEATPYSIIFGLVMAVVFSAAAAYSGLRIGQVLEAAIPIAIIAVGASKAFNKKKALGQNVIIQSIGASSGVIVAGAVFTIPALYILNLDVSFFHIFLSSMLGGFLGILFLIPFRRYFVKDMHGKFPFPEATATTEILITGEKGGSSAGILILSGVIGGLYDFMFASLKLWEEVFTSKVLPYGEMLANKYKMLFQLNVSSMIFGFGYLVGLRFSTIIAVGSLLSWFVFIPLINQVGIIAANLGASLFGIDMAGAGVTEGGFFASMSAQQIFTEYVRPIGIGAIAMAGIIGIIKSSKVIGSAFSLAFKSFGGKKTNGEAEHRTQKDISMTFVITFIGLTLAGIIIYLLLGFQLTFMQALVAFLTVAIISFLFTTVAANAIAIVGTNPVSGMTLMTLILSSVVLVQVGLTGSKGMTSALIIGGIVCTALSMAGGFITDLKIGYWIGVTPKTQEKWKFLGTILSAATVGIVIYVLNEAYGFVQTPQHPDPMVAPQANAMAAVIQPLMSGAEVNWMLYAIGAIISILLNWIGISPLAFALGMYLPLHLNTPLVVGGLLSHYMLKSSKDKNLAEARQQRGTLIASGLVAGAAIFGVIGAVLTYFKVPLNLNIWPEGSHGAEWLALIMFLAIVSFVLFTSLKAKPEDEA